MFSIAIAHCLMANNITFPADSLSASSLPSQPLLCFGIQKDFSKPSADNDRLQITTAEFNDATYKLRAAGNRAIYFYVVVVFSPN